MADTVPSLLHLAITYVSLRLTLGAGVLLVTDSQPLCFHAATLPLRQCIPLSPPNSRSLKQDQSQECWLTVRTAATFANSSSRQVLWGRVWLGSRRRNGGSWEVTEPMKASRTETSRPGWVRWHAPLILK